MNMRKFAILVGILLEIGASALVSAADMTAPVQPSEIKWGPAPPFLPPSAEMAVLAGDPTGAGMITLRLKMPAGYKIPPHWHPTDEHVTVISGTLALGMVMRPFAITYVNPSDDPSRKK